MVAVASPPALSFKQAPGRTSRNQLVTVTNNGRTPITLGKIDIVGPHAPQFAREVSSTCVSGMTVAQGASCEFAINFTPMSSGMYAAELVIPRSDSSRPTVVKLSGVAPDASSQAPASGSSAMLNPQTSGNNGQ